MAGTAMLIAALTICVLMVLTWALSVRVGNASIVDIVWGLGFVLVAWTVFLATDGNQARRLLLVTMSTVWGLRLAIYLFVRNHGKGEDYRYKAMRRRNPRRFARQSLYTVFGLQGVLLWIVSLPVQLGQVRHRPDIGVLAILGLALWVLGLFFEAVGDAQLARFKRNPASAGQLMDRGLWRYTRHPNYFGDACVWWGIALVASETGVGAIGLIGAALMTVLLVRVSGVRLLERSLNKRKPGYADYVARTSAFVPLPPKRR